MTRASFDRALNTAALVGATAAAAACTKGEGT
jgi:hypothetical protein